MFFNNLLLNLVPHIVYYWENRTAFVSLKTQYVSFPCKCINIKTIDKNSNKEFVKHKLVYYPSMFIVM